MPLIGNKCPGLDEYHTFESGHCLQKCAHQCMPASVLVHIENRTRHDKHVGQYISVTSLLGCLRQLYGERTMDYYIEPRKSWYSLRGTLLHNILEKPGFAAQVEDMRRYVYRLFKSGEISREDLEGRWVEIEASLLDFAQHIPVANIPNWQSEVEYEMPLGVVNGKQRFLRGTIDVFRPETGELYDYKTIGDRGLSIIKNGPKEDHVKQFNIYRLLVERGYPVGMSYETYKPTQIQKIVAFYMTMMQVVATGSLMDESTGWLKNGPSFHQNQVGDPLIIGEKTDLVLKRGKRRETAQPEDYELSEKRRFKVTYAIPEVPFMNLDELEDFVREKAAILIDAFDNGTMPPMCGPEMRQWKCDGFCPDTIRNWCDAYNETVGESRIVVKEEFEIPVEV